MDVVDAEVEADGVVLDHVVAFGFAVHEHVEPEPLPQRDDVGDLGARAVAVLVVAAQFRAGDADLRGLR